ncbi:MAG: c-type cytochrome [Bacteroidales bacterium]
MKRILKIFLYIILFVIIAFGGFLIYVKTALPNVGEPEDIKVELTSQRIERGRYLANSVAFCMNCHSKRDWNTFSGPIVEGSYGQGGEEFNQSIGYPGRFVANNLTPFGIGNWTDGELLRAIASGVNKQGKALFPIMPHPNYGNLDREDIYSIISYLRTLPPVEFTPPSSEADFPMNFIINAIPEKAVFSKIPDSTDLVAYGKYIFTAASCNDCHTKQIKGKPVKGMELAGGFEFPLFTGGIVRSSNITPDLETGIGKWTEEQFISKFKSFADTNYVLSKVKNDEFNTFMPWSMYAHMKEGDLKALYAFLRTVTPVYNPVLRFSPTKKIE